jgi:hypothetical protein
VLVKHDMGCRFARGVGVELDDDGNIIAGGITPGHSDAAKRISDHYNLHKAAGAIVGWWLAFSLNDGSHDGEAYATKFDAVRHQHQNEWWFTYVKIGLGAMSVCEAESLLYMGRQQAKLKLPDRDDRRGGMDVIPRLTREDHWRQMEALRTGTGFIGLGYRN